MNAAINWWRRNAANPLLLEESLLSVFVKLAANPLGIAASSRRVPDAQRLMLVTRHLVFFRVDHDLQEVIVLRVWHSSRGRLPKL